MRHGGDDDGGGHTVWDTRDSLDMSSWSLSSEVGLPRNSKLVIEQTIDERMGGLGDGLLRYANNSEYKRDHMIRKEGLDSLCWTRREPQPTLLFCD